jgi:hypothetical protein
MDLLLDSIKQARMSHEIRRGKKLSLVLEGVVILSKNGEHWQVTIRPGHWLSKAPLPRSTVQTQGDMAEVVAWLVSFGAQNVGNEAKETLEVLT